MDSRLLSDGDSWLVEAERGGATYGVGDSYALHLLYVLQPDIDIKEGLAGRMELFHLPAGPRSIEISHYRWGYLVI